MEKYFDINGLEEKLEKLREELRKKAKNLSWQEEGKLLEKVDKLKEGLNQLKRYSQLVENVEKIETLEYSPYTLEMKIKRSQISVH
jgi:hypothetical protein